MGLFTPTEWGPAFWMAKYGFRDLADFQEQTRSYADGFQVYGASLPADALTLDAWYNPGSGIAAYLIIQLEANNFQEGALSSAAHYLGSSVATPVARSYEENDMPQLIVPGAFLVAITGQVGSRQVTNVIGVQKPGGTAQGAANTVRTAFKRAGSFLPLLPAQYVLTSVTATDLSTSDGQVVQVADNTAGGNTQTGQIATAGACAVIAFSAGTRNRSSKGRMYFGPLTEGMIDADGRSMVANYQNFVTQAVAQFQADLTAAGYPQVVISRKNSSATVITTSSVEATIGTQRRRIRG